VVLQILIRLVNGIILSNLLSKYGNMNDKENIPQRPGLGGIGRTNFIKENEANIEKISRDLSNMDRQEGDMDPGIKGGNFDEASINEKQMDKNE